jgi:hypothetical protein
VPFFTGTSNLASLFNMNGIYLFSDRSGQRQSEQPHFIMSSLEPLRYTVHLKEPSCRADDTIGLSVYLNEQLEENYAPTFYKRFMSCIRSTVESSTSSSSSAVSSSDQDEEMKMFRRVYSTFV